MRRRSLRTTRGRAPAPPNSDVSGGQSKKRTADDFPARKHVANRAENADNADDDNTNDDDPTPRKKGKAKAIPPSTNDSPPRPCPRQRLRTNEAGDAVDASNIQPAEEPEWYATDAVRPKYFDLFALNHLLCLDEMSSVCGQGPSNMRPSMARKEVVYSLRILCRAKEKLSKLGSMACSRRKVVSLPRASQ